MQKAVDLKSALSKPKLSISDCVFHASFLYPDIDLTDSSAIIVYHAV